MVLGRREFLKASAGATGLVLLQPSRLITQVRAEAGTGSQSNVAMLIDVSKCMGCWMCYAACKNCNNLPETINPTREDPPELSAHTWTTLFTSHRGDGEWIIRKHACMHCADASCEQVCPTGAISHQGAAVVINQEWCIGCGYCVQACPFGVPHKEHGAGGGAAKKCTFCVDLQADGLVPACVEACPAGALQSGERTDLIQVAKTRVKALQADGYSNANLYGEHESGGLHVLYVLTDRPSVYDLPEAPQVATSQAVFKWLSGVIAAGVIAALPFWLLFRRKKQIEAERQSRVEGGTR
ncbi:4Fe-4S dicluster domain-containing protein [Chloroflexota bacterium]